MVRNDQLPENGRASKLLAARVRELIDERGLTQSEVGECIGRAQSYASLRIKGMKSWTIEELDQLARRLGYSDAFALIARACVPEAQEPNGEAQSDAMSPTLTFGQMTLAAKRGDTEAEQEAFEELP